MADPTLTSPWMACLADSHGFCTDDIEEMIDNCGSISVVRATALPNGRDGGLRLPGSHFTTDVLYEKDVEDYEEDDQLREAWALAQRVAMLLNSLELTS